MLLCLVCFCWQQCLVIACYMTRQPQAARPLFRMTKWTLLQAVSQERGCVVFGHPQAGRRGGEKQDAIGTGHGRVTESPGRAPVVLQPTAAWPWGQGGTRLSQCLPCVTNFLRVRGCFVLPWLFPHSDSAALSSLYSVLLSLPADRAGKRPVITDGALLTPRTHSPILVFNQHQLMQLCISSARGGFPRTRFSCWPAVSAPPSPLQTPVICTEAAWPLPCLQPNPGAPWNPGFFAICNCKRTEMKQRDFCVF